MDTDTLLDIAINAAWTQGRSRLLRSLCRRDTVALRCSPLTRRAALRAIRSMGGMSDCHR